MKARTHRNLMKSLCDGPLAIDSRWLGRMEELLVEHAPKRAIAAAVRGSRATPVPRSSGNVAIIPVCGALVHRAGIWAELFGAASVERISADFDAAIADSTVETVVMVFDTPGGRTDGIEEFAAKIFAARSVKKIVGVADALCASAGYWLLTACTEAVATSSAVVGSIGAMCAHFDDSEWEKKQGFKTTWITTSKFKGEDRKPLTEESQANYQRYIDGFGEKFEEAVAKYRGTTTANVSKNFGQGTIFNAQDALTRGMVDRVATLEQVLAELGVGQASTSTASRPAFSLEGMSMKPELFGELVRAKMCEITATDDNATAALARFCAAKSVKVDDEAAALAALKEFNAHPIETATGTKPGTLGSASEREATIRAAIKIAPIPSGEKFDFLNSLVSAKDDAGKPISVDAALARINDKVTAANPPAGPSEARIEAGEAGRDKFMAHATHALLQRQFGGNIPKRVYDRESRNVIEYKAPEGASSQVNYDLQSLPRLAEMCLAQDGWQRTQISRLDPMARMKLAMGGQAAAQAMGIYMSVGGPAYNTTGSFPYLLMDAANKSLRKGYEEAEVTFKRWTRQGSPATDFKDIYRIAMGELSSPLAVPENGELQELTTNDQREKYALVMWGGRFSISFQAMMNDDMNALSRIPQLMGGGFPRRQNSLVYQILKDNPTLLSTGGALFNATAQATAGGHNNLTTGSAVPTVATLNAMRAKMRKQKGGNIVDGRPLNITAKYLLTGTPLEGTVDTLLASMADPAASQSGVANIWKNKLEPIYEPELDASAGGSDTAWHLAADPSVVDTIEYVYLQGYESPVIEQEQGFTHLCMWYRGFQPFQAAPIDYRGLQKHAGV